jgi:hypothetical protein
VARRARPLRVGRYEPDGATGAARPGVDRARRRAEEIESIKARIDEWVGRHAAWKNGVSVVEYGPQRLKDVRQGIIIFKMPGSAISGIPEFPVPRNCSSPCRAARGRCRSGSAASGIP